MNSVPPIINETGKGIIVLSQVSGEDWINEKLLSGKEGELLLSLLMDSGLRAKDFSFTSIGTFVEVLRAVSPQYILTMGNDAMQATTKKSGIKKYRGDKLSLHESFKFECFVYPTYSISDLRAVPTYRKTIVADLRNSQQSEDPETVEFEYWSTYGD